MQKISAAALALAATTTFAVAGQMDRGNGPAAGSNSVAEHAPTKIKESGSAKAFAPGETKEGKSAKETAPSQQKDQSASSRYEKQDPAQYSEHSQGEKNPTDRNANNERLNNNDKKSEQSRIESKSSASTGAGEGTEGRSNSKGSITGVTEEQRTRVKSAFSQHRVEPARNLDVSVNVGVALPRSVHLYPMPEDVVAIVPEYRGYDYVMIDANRIAIIDPATFEVVDIIVVA